MAPSNPLSYWERVGDSFYRKVPVYDAIFDEDVELENYIVAGAPYGGAIGMAVCVYGCCHQYTDATTALYRDESKLYRFQGAQTTKSSIDVYSCSGKHINRINVGPGLSWLFILLLNDNMLSGNTVLYEASAGPIRKNSW